MRDERQGSVAFILIASKPCAFRSESVRAVGSFYLSSDDSDSEFFEFFKFFLWCTGFTQVDDIFDGIASQSCLRELICVGSPCSLQVVVEIFEEGFEADEERL
jgi:hypothetical protein